MVRTWVHTPRFCGEPLPRRTCCVDELSVNRNAGALVFFVVMERPLRTSWLIVGIISPHQKRSA
jgi:hypothetical protein